MVDKQRLYGLVVHSERETHQNRAFDEGSERDVLLRWDHEVADQDVELAGRNLLEYSPGRPFYAASVLEDGGFALRFHGAADFFITPDLGVVTGRATALSSPDYAMVLATGAVLAFQLYARQLPVLHASAVDLGGIAVAFTGFAGMGKSTMATVLCAEGGRLITMTSSVSTWMVIAC